MGYTVTFIGAMGGCTTEEFVDVDVDVHEGALFVTCEETAIIEGVFPLDRLVSVLID